MPEKVKSPMNQRNIPYSIVDVFTQTQFSGNPVAVIHDARQLSDEEMQSITVEFGFSETTFILPPENNASDARVRIFTPVEEIPFAGHPNIGTAFAIATNETVIGQVQANRQLIFDELGGSVAVSLQTENDQVTGAKITAPQALEVLGNCNIELVAQCLGLPPKNIVTERFSPCVATIGLPFAFVEVTNLDALGNIEMSIADFQQAKIQGPETVDGFAICVFTVLDQSDHDITIRSRVLSPLGFPPEDPATGSASGALAALLTPAQKTDNYGVNIEQGVEMGRPSQIRVNMPSKQSCPEIAGHCVNVSTGTLFL